MTEKLSALANFSTDLFTRLTTLHAIDMLAAVDIGRSSEPPLPGTMIALPYAYLPDGVWKAPCRRARALSLLWGSRLVLARLPGPFCLVLSFCLHAGIRLEHDSENGPLTVESIL